MHACGHDGHAAWLLGSAMILSKLRSQFRSREICIPARCCVRFCLQSAARILGEEHVKLDTNPHLGGEDFSEYVARVPGAYVYAGIATEKNQGTTGLHSSSFMLEESVIPGMAAVFAQFAVDFLEKGGF